MTKENFNGLTPGQTERLAFLSEECAEVIQIVGKILRHGIDSYNPTDPNQISNRKLLEIELGDVAAATRLLGSANDIMIPNVTMNADSKVRSCGRWMHHQEVIA